MYEPCQCNWHHFQYCPICEDDFADQYYTDPDADRRQQKQDNEYLADLEEGVYSETGQVKDSVEIIETAERVELDTADYLQELVQRYGLNDIPMAVAGTATL